MPGTVSVASKLPHGLVLQHQVEREIHEPVMGGGTRSVKRFAWTGKRVVINGFAVPADRPTGKQIVGGFALTHGVDADFFAEWMRQNAEHPAVEAGLIFASSKPETAEGGARDRRDVASGFEPINPEKLPAEFRRSIATAAA